MPSDNPTDIIATPTARLRELLTNDEYVPDAELEAIGNELDRRASLWEGYYTTD